MKKFLLFPFLMACTLLLLFNSCKPNLADDAYRVGKPWIDDAIAWGSRAAKGRYTVQKLQKISKVSVFRSQPSEILGPKGARLFKLNNGKTYYQINEGEMVLAADETYLKNAFDTRYQKVVKKMFELVDQYEIYPKDFTLLVRQSIADAAGSADEFTKAYFDESASKLIIEFKEYKRSYNIRAVFADASMVSSGIMIGNKGYYVIKESLVK